MLPRRFQGTSRAIDADEGPLECWGAERKSVRQPQDRTAPAMGKQEPPAGRLMDRSPPMLPGAFTGALSRRRCSSLTTISRFLPGDKAQSEINDSGHPAQEGENRGSQRPILALMSCHHAAQETHLLAIR